MAANLTVLSLLMLGLLSARAAAGTPDPSLCPSELGYNPSFNADGTILSCSKGQESFQVDPEGILPTSLRGIGQTVLVALEGLAVGNPVPFANTVEPGATFQLPDGTFHAFNDPAVQSSLGSIFQFAPGTDASAIVQVSDYHFLSNGPPRYASVHLTIESLGFVSNFDSFYHLNMVNGSLVWQIHANTGFVGVPV